MVSEGTSKHVEKRSWLISAAFLCCLIGVAVIIGTNVRPVSAPRKGIFLAVWVGWNGSWTAFLSNEDIPVTLKPATMLSKVMACDQANVNTFENVVLVTNFPVVCVNLQHSNALSVIQKHCGPVVAKDVLCCIGGGREGGKAEDNDIHFGRHSNYSRTVMARVTI